MRRRAAAILSRHELHDEDAKKAANVRPSSPLLCPSPAIFARVQAMVFGETTAQRLPHPPARLPLFVHLALALGLYIPPYLAACYRQAAAMIG